jgi:hypothetical protein
MELQTENWSCGVHRQLAAGESIGDGCPERFAVADLQVGFPRFCGQWLKQLSC